MYPTTHAVIGDAKATLQSLVKELGNGSSEKKEQIEKGKFASTTEQAMAQYHEVIPLS
ncbi:MAG: hypothetical protein CM1200mP39_11880 [Dehalococcoidia bacterium]|nr:MAG: hypothetical protein CM1200mP39_11880 [Dehalococcoidia bacterium]